jgi:hypothetical protein
MQRIDHPLLSPSLGSQKTLTSFHFGTPGSGCPRSTSRPACTPRSCPACWWRTICASPWKQQTRPGPDHGGEIVLVPVANPIGLAQRLDHKPMGRFDLDTSENFNRHYPDFAAKLFTELRTPFTTDAAHNVQLVRQAMRTYLQRWQPAPNCIACAAPVVAVT